MAETCIFCLVSNHSDWSENIIRLDNSQFEGKQALKSNQMSAKIKGAT